MRCMGRTQGQKRAVGVRAGTMGTIGARTALDAQSFSLYPGGFPAMTVEGVIILSDGIVKSASLVAFESNRASALGGACSLGHG